MGRIDSISKALESKHGVDLATGKFIEVNNYHNMDIDDDDINIDIDDDNDDETINDESIISNVANVISNVIPPMNVSSQNINENAIEDERSEEYNQDEDNVKRNIRELIQKGMDLADDMFEIVRVSESAKSFEPASAYLKTLVELNEKLLDIHDRRNKNKKSVKEEKGGNVTTTTNNVQTNNVAVTMSPAELLKLMKGK
jgi:hypothetical protein